MTKDEILNMPAGRELDALIAVNVMGWHININTERGNSWVGSGLSFGELPEFQLPEFSRDISSAWRVVDHMIKEKDYGIQCRANESCGNAVWTVEFYELFDNWTVGKKFVAVGEVDFPLGVCHAALLATLTASENQ